MVFTIGIGIGALLLITMGVLPQLQAMGDLRTDVSRKRPQLEKIEQKLAQLENVRYTPEFSQVDVISRALPSRKPLLELLTNLNLVAVTKEIEIVEFQISPGIVATDSAELAAGARRTPLQQEIAGIDSLELAVSVKGPRENLHEFLNEIEKISPFTTIVKLSISSRKEGETDARAELTLNTFFFTQAIKTTVDAPLPVLADQDLFVLSELSSFEINELPEQGDITGGGLEDLFGVDPIEFLN